MSEEKKKEYNVEPTNLQKKTFEKLVEVGGSSNIDKGSIIKQAGGSDATAKTPSKIFKAKGFLKLVEEKLSDELLTDKHWALLNKEEVIVKNNNKTGQIEVIPTGQIDTNSVKAGLDMAYKIKGSYAPEKKEETKKVLNINIDLNKLSPEQLEKFAQTGNL